MKGYVIQSREVIVPLILLDAEGNPCEIDAVLDTGANCSLTLPPDALAFLRATYLREDVATVAGDEVLDCRVFEGDVVWSRGPTTVEVFEVDSIPLLGMHLLDRHRVTIDVIDGGPVDISQLTP